MRDFLQLTFQGLALGSVYALIALGFVIIYKATGVINFAQGELMVLGAYIVWGLANQADMNFYVALLGAMAVMGGAGFGIERTILRRMVGRPVFAVVMITIALAIVIRQLVTAVWGFQNKTMGDPWGSTIVTIGGIRMALVSIAMIVVATVLLVAFFLFFKYTKIGVAMRATAFDTEAALAVGIPARRVHGLSWAIAAAVATVGGVFLAAYPSSLHPALGFTALRAFPAAILGGLDSPGGAVVGGLVIGLIELWSQGYQHRYAPWLGANFHVVAAYVLMIAVLMVRPYGLFGTREVERV